MEFLGPVLGGVRVRECYDPAAVEDGFGAVDVLADAAGRQPYVTGEMDGGDKGGTVIAKGAPKEVAETPGSYTGEYLKRIFDNATPEHYLQPKKK